MKNYDVIIIGAGPSGIFCAYELIHAKKNLKILMIEKGRRIEKRECPKRKTKVCVGCKPCSITTGFAGAGAFSDGKLSLSPDVGGNLPEILGYDRTIELLKESDDIYLKFGADTKVYGVDKEKEILKVQAMNEGKPEAIAEKMVQGRIKKYYEDFCLLEQPFIKDGDITVSKYIENCAKELGGEIKAVSFVRFEKGEGLEKREDNFADEVASMMK